jgi:hypothetical protein
MQLRSVFLAASLAAFPLPVFAAGGEAADQTAAPPSHLTLAMTLYAGGITLGKVDMDATIIGDKYHAVSNLQTAGIVNALWQSTIQATSSGQLSPGHFQPALYDSFYTGRSGHKQEVSLTYEAGNIRLYANPPYSVDKYPVSEALKKNTFDPLSAIIYVTSGVGMDQKNPCGVTAPVFDGKRRYAIEMKKEKDVQVSMDNGLYKGAAIQCQVRYNQIAGFSQHVLSENASFPVVHAWFVKFPSSVTGRDYIVPLRAWADTEYGTVAGVTSSLKIDGVDKAGK